MISPELYTDEEVDDFVRNFYAKVRCDDLIKPVFNAASKTGTITLRC